MAATSRGLRSLNYSSTLTCSRCLRFSTSSNLASGHNRWSKIKHDKGAADAKKNVQRSAISHEIAQASKLYGGDPVSNSVLAAVLVNAKKAGFPKASMEAAIARGQGISATGLPLESLTMEFLAPPSFALVADMETDNRNRTLAELRSVIKKQGGTVTPTSYLFRRRGRVQFERDERALGVDEVLDDAIEAGAEDVEVDEEGNIVVWTEPSETIGAAKALVKSLNLTVQSSDLLWDAKEDTLVPIESEAQFELLSEMIDAVQEYPGVQGVYANVSQGAINDESWQQLQEKIAV